jgi:hypothetical protein
MGDTRPQQDPPGHGQDLSGHLGKMLRIDVNRTYTGLAYAIPADNRRTSGPTDCASPWLFRIFMRLTSGDGEPVGESTGADGSGKDLVPRATGRAAQLLLPPSSLMRCIFISAEFFDSTRRHTLLSAARVSYGVGFAPQIAKVSGEPWARTPLSVRISSVAASICARGKIIVSPKRILHSTLMNSSLASRRISTK